jgi:hypothetical protein
MIRATVGRDQRLIDVSGSEIAEGARKLIPAIRGMKDRK